MFESIQPAPPDSILGITEAFNKDSNPNKINLSVGVYQEEDGKTPILECVKLAEKKLLVSETSKGYLGIDGLPQFKQQIPSLLFGANHRIVQGGLAAALQTPGGTGGLRVAADLIKRRFPSSTVWCSKPTWPNHNQIFEASGLNVQSYNYLDSTGTSLDLQAIIGSLTTAKAGDVVCLHASCHNPTGIDPTGAEWKKIGDLIQEKGLLPLFDCAYQGFGDGVEEDVRSIAEVCREGVEAIVVNSFSKNFGLYSERVGGMTIVAKTPEQAQAVASHAKTCVRVNYSNPPKHGGIVVSTILADEALRGLWLQELEKMRNRINGMRKLLVEKMAAKTSKRDFGFLLKQRGMFSFTGLNAMQADRLRAEFGIYIVGTGRINVAGISTSNIDRLCDSIAAVL